MPQSASRVLQWTTRMQHCTGKPATLECHHRMYCDDVCHALLEASSHGCSHFGKKPAICGDGVLPQSFWQMALFGWKYAVA
jgi:hypothetical protein